MRHILEDNVEYISITLPTSYYPDSFCSLNTRNAVIYRMQILYRIFSPIRGDRQKVQRAFCSAYNILGQAVGSVELELIENIQRIHWPSIRLITYHNPKFSGPVLCKGICRLTIDQSFYFSIYKHPIENAPEHRDFHKQNRPARWNRPLFWHVPGQRSLPWRGYRLSGAGRRML